MCYRAITAVEHKGSSPTSGHYVTYRRNSQSSDWWLFDDNKVTEYL